MSSNPRNVAAARNVGAALALLLIPIGGCTEANLIGPSNQLEVANDPGAFEWQVTALDRVTQTLTYSWSNPGIQADVNQSSASESGVADLRITDSAGAEVYARTLSQNGTFQTSAGRAGTWTITVTLDRATGSLNFRIETP